MTQGKVEKPGCQRPVASGEERRMTIWLFVATLCLLLLVHNGGLSGLDGETAYETARSVVDHQRLDVGPGFNTTTGIGGLELSLTEGEIAGLAVANRHVEVRKLFSAREKQRRFARILNETFALRNELKNLATNETFVCRCEDVSFGRLREYNSWRAAKLQTRCLRE